MTFSDVRKLAIEIEHLIRQSEVRELPRKPGAEITDYRRQKKELSHRLLNAKIQRFSEIARTLFRSTTTPEEKKLLDKIAPLLSNVSPSADVLHFREVLRSIIALIPETLDEKKKDEEFQLPRNMPAEINEEVCADFHELKTCYASGAYRSSVILCGRILEAALHRKYFDVTGNDLLEKAPGIGLGNLIAK